MLVATRYHDISCGHRVVGHENKCRHLHGHNYRVTFTVEMDEVDATDAVGRVLDFSVIKDRLCMWLEATWDHKMLLWQNDPLLVHLTALGGICAESIVIVPFNPTAENMAQYLVTVIGPAMLHGTGTKLIKCVVEETRKCAAEFSCSR